MLLESQVLGKQIQLLKVNENNYILIDKIVETFS